MSTTRAGFIWWASHPAHDMNQDCEGFVFTACEAFGTVSHGYGSAALAAADSGWLDPDPTTAPLGAIGYWTIPGVPAGHVAISLGGDNWACGSDHCITWFDEELHTGTITTTSYHEATGATFTGWAKTNGGNTISITPDTDANTRTVIANDSHIRVSPNTSSAIYATVNAGDLVEAFCYVTNGTSVNGNRVWYGLTTNGWISAAIVKEGTVLTGLKDETPVAVPVVAPAEVSTPTPVVEPVAPVVTPPAVATEPVAPVVTPPAAPVTAPTPVVAPVTAPVAVQVPATPPATVMTPSAPVTAPSSPSKPTVTAKPKASFWSWLASVFAKMFGK